MQPPTLKQVQATLDREYKKIEESIIEIYPEFAELSPEEKRARIRQALGVDSQTES